ncbi:MAG: hypothetical protein D6719_10830 [Candidatus Dadabacteria bacterium]|nr:MAG: hypothetical protein D6719_10830 [Candidatus Dadabacteria bacterium]
MENQDSNTDNQASSILSQATYKETPYEDATWEVIGERIDNETFVPLELEIIRTSDFEIDPMFADYGGRLDPDQTKRWHLPEHLAHKTEEERAKEQEEKEKISLEEEELEKIKQEAYEAGHAAAIAELEEQAKSDREAQAERIATFLQDLKTQIEEGRKEVEKLALEFSLNVAKKIIDTAVEINPEYIVQIIREAISQAGSAAIKRILVSPEDLEFIELVGLKERLPEYEGDWNFEADSSIHSGCVVETTAGQIDYQLDQAWERIKEEVVKIAK